MSDNKKELTASLMVMFLAQVILALIVISEASILWVAGVLVASLLLVMPVAPMVYKDFCVIGGFICCILVTESISATDSIYSKLSLLMAGVLVLMGVRAVARDHS